MIRTIFLLLFICVNSFIYAQQFSITARITGFPDGTRFYLNDPEEGNPLDSAFIKNNSFVMKGKINESPQLFWLTTQYNNKFYWCTIFMGNENVIISGDKKDFPFYMTISGSKIQDTLNVLTIQTRSYDKHRDSLVSLIGPVVFDTSEESRQKVMFLDKQIQTIDSTVKLFELQFIESHLNTHAGLFLLSFKAYYFEKDVLQKMYNVVDDILKQSKYGRKIYNYLKVGEPVKEGQFFFDFEAADTSGNRHKLSTYKGQYILLDFTETYCAPCIKAVQELKDIANTYTDKITIISFCVDKSRETWIKGLRRDKVSWLSLWDSNGQDSDIALKYDITAYPTFFLINPDGIVISRSTGYGNGSLIALIKNIN